MAASSFKLSSFFAPEDPAVKPPKGRHRCVKDGCNFTSAYRADALRTHLESMHGDDDDVKTYFRLFRRARSVFDKGGARKRAPTSQGTLAGRVRVLTPAEKEHLNHMAAQYLILDGAAFNALTKPGLRALLRAANPAWTLPSPRSLVDKYIPRVCTSIENAVAEKLKAASVLTLTTDAWKRNRLFLNAVVVCTPDPVLIGVYRANEREDGAYLRRLLQHVLNGELLGPHKGKVKAVMTDNGSAVKSARKEIAAELGCDAYHCAAHGVNLVASDVLRHPEGPVATLLARVRKVVRALRTPSVVKELNKSNALSARVDNDTRWNSTLDMMRRLLELRDTAKAIAESTSLIPPDVADGIVLDPLFWDELEGVVNIMEPLAAWQDSVQRDNATLADLFHEYTCGHGKYARNKAAVLRGRHEALGEVLVQKLDTRLHDLIPPVALAAYYLHPRYGGECMFGTVDELDHRERAIQLCFSEEDSPAAAKELNDFIKAVREQRYSSMKDEEWVMRRPGNWWTEQGGRWPTLQPVGERLLSLAAHAAACERVWSALRRLFRPDRQSVSVNNLNTHIFSQWNARYLRVNETADEHAPPRKRGTGSSQLEVEGSAAGEVNGSTPSTPFPDLVADARCAREEVAVTTDHDSVEEVEGSNEDACA